LIQSISAAAYRGKTVRVRAWIKVEAGAPGDHAQVYLQVTGLNRRTGLHAERDLRADLTTFPGWTSCEIEGRVDKDAQFLEFGFRAYGHGQVWIDDVSFEVVNGTE
jgi:hypothetical protein